MLHTKIEIQPKILGTADDAVGTRPRKTFVQRYRLHVRSCLLILVLGLLLVTDRSLDGSALGFGLYALGSTILIAAVVGRFWCYVYNSGARTKTVITEGPYSLCRNPIYLCSIGVAAGIGMLSQSAILSLVFGASALLFYAHIIAGEEAKLTAIHGDVYTRYLEGTSKYVPRFDRLSPGVLREVPGKILMRKIPKLIALALVFPLIQVCDALRDRLGVSLWEIF